MNRVGTDYIYQAYPRWRYHRAKASVIVKNAKEEAELGPGWASSPDAFDEKAAIRTTDRLDPLKWVDDWQVPVLREQDRVKIKGQLLKAKAAFSRETPKPARHAGPMQLAFNGIAKVLFESGILTAELLEKEICVLVWDSAIAGGWWRPASDQCTDGFPEQFGHYWFWADHSEERAGLFEAETAEWNAKLLETSGAGSVSPILGGSALSHEQSQKTDANGADLIEYTPPEVKSLASVNSAEIRGHGYEADTARHQTIADSVGRYDAHWKNGAKAWRKDGALSSICRDLDQQEIDIPKGWRTGETQSIRRKGVKVTGWHDAWKLGFRKLVCDQITYSLKMVTKNTPPSARETLTVVPSLR